MKFFSLFFLFVSIVFSSDLELAREKFKKYVDLKDIISKEKSSYKEEKIAMQSLIKVLKSNLKSINEKIAQYKTDIKKNDKERNRIIVKKALYEKSYLLIDSKIDSLENKMLNIFKYIPNSMKKENISLLNQLKNKDTQKNLTKRIKIILSILSFLNNRCKAMSLYKENVNINGKKFLISSLYIGLSYGYFVSSSNEIAGLIVFDKGTWKYLVKNDIAKEVSKTINIYTAKKRASFVRLPFYPKGL